jgi:hypothetical protein
LVLSFSPNPSPSPWATAVAASKARAARDFMFFIVKESGSEFAVKAKGRTPGGDFERVFERVWLRSVVDSSSKLMKKKERGKASQDGRRGLKI